MSSGMDYRKYQEEYRSKIRIEGGIMVKRIAKKFVPLLVVMPCCYSLIPVLQ